MSVGSVPDLDLDKNEEVTMIQRKGKGVRVVAFTEAPDRDREDIEESLDGLNEEMKAHYEDVQEEPKPNSPTKVEYDPENDCMVVLGGWVRIDDHTPDAFDSDTFMEMVMGEINPMVHFYQALGRWGDEELKDIGLSDEDIRGKIEEWRE